MRKNLFIIEIIINNIRLSVFLVNNPRFITMVSQTALGLINLPQTLLQSCLMAPLVLHL